VNLSVHRLAVIVLALLVVSMPLRGDEKSPAKPAEKLPHQDDLERLVGSWDATVTYFIGTKENQGKAVCEAKWILDRHCVQQEYQSKFMGSPLTILQLLSYDAMKKKLIEIHMTNLHGGALCNEGDVSADGKEWKLSGPYMNLQTMKAAPLRTVYTFEDKDHFTLDWFLPGSDGKETRLIHITHARKK
jgi:hypothetical protein